MASGLWDYDDDVPMPQPAQQEEVVIIDSDEEGGRRRGRKRKENKPLAKKKIAEHPNVRPQHAGLGLGSHCVNTRSSVLVAGVNYS